MASAILGVKGQTTIPQNIRAALNLKPRQRLEWTVRSDGTVTVRAELSALALFGSLHPSKRFPGRKAERKATMRAVAAHAANEGINIPRQ